MEVVVCLVAGGGAAAAAAASKPNAKSSLGAPSRPFDTCPSNHLLSVSQSLRHHHRQHRQHRHHHHTTTLAALHLFSPPPSRPVHPRTIVSRTPPPSLRASQTPSALHPKTHSWPHTTPPQTTRLSPRMTESSSDSVANGTIALSPILHDAPLTLCASSNMLYPREDKETNQLIFQCRNCQWPTAVGPTCIYRNEVSHNLRETAGVVTDVASDPTVCYFRPPPSIPLKLTSTSATPCRERLRKPEMRRKRRRLLPKSAT